MDSRVVLDGIRGLEGYSGQMVHIEHIPPREAVYGRLDSPLPAPLQECLTQRGLAGLYSHQAEAINHARSGKNVIVATASASGKTLCYNIAVMEALLENRRHRAMYLFPTKALAQDQLTTLDRLFGRLLEPNAFATFDGDTPYSERGEIRREARIILTNPDMLHLGIMPNHRTWSTFFRHLKYVIVDEAHNYRGVFGSHVALVLRRLRRLCRLYGSSPQFILSTATIANPGEHAAALTGLPFEVVDRDGSPHGAKDFVFWNPPLVDEARSARRSANSEATSLFTHLVEKRIRTLAFARTRRLTELIYMYSKKRLAETAPDLAERIKPYRAGYLAEERRKIERQLFGGDLWGVVATNALELGIDSGGLEATIITGYPGSIASTWQQAGRSGRTSEDSLSFLLALNNPLDQYLMRHPDFFFKSHFESALVNPANPHILDAHLLCAAWEWPLSQADEDIFDPSMIWERELLENQGRLVKRRERWFLSPSVSAPASAVNIRSGSSQNYNVVDASTGALLETVESSVAFFQVHPGAIYLHQGEAYLVKKLDLINRVAYTEPVEANYYTHTKELEDVRILKVLREKAYGGIKVYLGELEVTNQVVGYKRKAQFTDEVLGEEPLDLPPQSFQTVGLWFDLPPGAEQKLGELNLDFAGGIHATEHAAIGILPLFALCDRNDIGGLSTPLHPDTGQAEIFIYDGHPGGIGIAEKGFDIIGDLWQATRRAVAECPCEAGCPSCIQSPKCGNNNKPLDKQAASVLLDGLLTEYKGESEGAG